MRLRHSADFRSLFWAFVLFPLVPIAGYLQPSVAPWLLPLGLYLAYCAGVLTHNHNHCPVFVSRGANRAYAGWLSVFYGAPAFTWVPTHNQNHHRYVNADGDVARTTRYAKRDRLWRALSYPLFCGVWQLGLIAKYVRKAQHRPERLADIRLQVAALVVAHGGMFALALALHGLGTGAGVYLLGFGLPALFAPWSMMFTNYVQHAGCDATSPHDHSRNFVSPLVNWFVFDAGYHTVHHENPGVHWSRYRALHRERSADIDPRLNPSTILSHCVTTYLVEPAWRTTKRALASKARSGHRQRLRGARPAP